MILFLLVACGSHPAAPTKAPGGVALWVDDAQVATWTGPESVTLAQALPAGSAAPQAWKVVEATSGPRTLVLSDPSVTWAGADIELTVDAAGTRGIEVVRAPDPSLPPAVRAVAARPLASLDRVEAVHVHTTLPTPPPAPVGQLLVRMPGTGMQTITTKDLADIPQTGQRRSQGWPLAALVKRWSGGHPVDAVVVHAGKEQVRVPAADLATGHYVMKFNRQGEWVYREFTGDTPAPAKELRGVDRIDLERAH